MSRLDKDVWHAISPLLDRALDLDGPARDAMVAELARDRPDLAAILARLLDEHAQLLGSPFLEASLDTPAPSLTGQTIGPYTLDVPLGMGGMGTVWRAHRSDGRFEGAVAVKLLNLGAFQHDGGRRFRREGTLLARLTHPHIARLLDAGVTTSGQPYLVLEYVEGTRIDHAADERRLDARARLDLFLQVAEAVAHAHANLVVHRDLKPSNILVGADGRIKLLDFGIAKLLEEEAAADQAERTGTGIHAFTPEYAAPEQARGDMVTTATDVYALGVLLHVLLTGQHPTNAGCRTVADHLQALLTNDPVRASDAIMTGGAPPNEIARRAEARQSAPERLRRLYRGDLDNILHKALAKQPADRYATVTAFADDVRRHLRDEPVSVKGDAWRYRTAKFLRRHKTSVASTALIALILIAATVISTQQLLEARRQRDEAEFQARRATASSEFMRNLVTQIGDTPMTMKQVLDRGRQALEQQYGDDPVFVARMLTQLSGAYIELGDTTTAARMMTTVLALATKADDAALLAGTHCGMAYDATETRQLDAAHTHMAEARRQIARLQTPATGLLVECAVSDTMIAIRENRSADAIDVASQAVRLLERDGNTSSTRYTSALNNLALAYGAAGRQVDTVRTQRTVNEVSERIGRARTISVVTSYNNLGTAERRLGWWLASQRSFEHAIDIAKGLGTSDVPAYLTVNYGRLLVDLGRTQEGMEWVRRTLAVPNTAPRFVNLAQLALASEALDRGQVDEARAPFDRAVRELGANANPGERASIAILTARFDRAAGRIEIARSTIDAAVRAEGYPGTLSPVVHQLLEYGSRLAVEAGDRDAAVRLAQDAVRACEQHFGTEDPSAFTGRAHLTLGLAELAAGRTDEGRRELERAATTIAAAAGADHPWVREAREAAGVSIRAQD